jgi:uncharacterized protein involved in exopolysaccharide biosynthesis
MTAPEDQNDKQSETSVLSAMLSRHRYLILTTAAVAAVVSFLLSLALPNIYTGTAVLLPPQQDQSSTALSVGQLLGGTAVGTGGIATALGLKNPNDLYVGILKSRTIVDRLIKRFDLTALYGEGTLVDTRKEVEENTKVSAGKDGLIRIEFEDRDPQRAAAIANAYVEELERLTETLAISEASRRRIYFEKQVEQTRKSLREADLALRDVQEDTGLIKPDEQARAIFETVATLRGKIAAKEVELASLRTFATDKNPELIRSRQELESMRSQLSGLERDNNLGSGDILLPTRKVPKAGLEFLSKYRDVKYYETVYELLAKQLELARIDEGKNATLIQVLDRAIPPDKKTRPKRGLIVVLSVLATTLIAVAVAIFIESNPSVGKKVVDLVWGGGR